MTHPGILFMRALSHLPLGAVRGLGTLLGRLLFVLARSRRRAALIHLRLAYPQWSEAERVALARRNFVYFAQAFLDRSWLWHAAPDLVRQRLRITGSVDDLTREGAVVMFAPHFYGMDAGGSAVMQQIDRPACTIYSTQPNPALDEWMQAGRQRFGDATLLSRTEGVKPIGRALREGKMLYLLPDMDLVTRLTDFGYEVKVHPAWPDYPSADATADAALMNQRLQGYIDEMPEQYYWVHKRFKTRPPGEASFY